MLPQGSHLTRKRGRIFYWRRRLPAPQHTKEIAISLRTRAYRLAEHRAEVLDSGWGMIVTAVQTGGVDLQPILRRYLERLLHEDEERHLTAEPGAPLYGRLRHEDDSPGDADLEHADRAIASTRACLRDRLVGAAAIPVGDLLRDHDVPKDQHLALGLGILRAQLSWETAKLRLTDGIMPPVKLDAPAAEPVSRRDVDASRPAASGGGGPTPAGRGGGVRKAHAR